jgi:hypothetical protein
MIRIAISPAAFDAVAATLPFGSVGYENGTNEKGERLIWLPPDAIAKLKRLRGPGELQRRDLAGGGRVIGAVRRIDRYRHTVALVKAKVVLPASLWRTMNCPLLFP